MLIRGQPEAWQMLDYLGRLDCGSNPRCSTYIILTAIRKIDSPTPHQKREAPILMHPLPAVGSWHLMLGYLYQVDPITQYAHQQLHPPARDRCHNREKDMGLRYQVLG